MLRLSPLIVLAAGLVSTAAVAQEQPPAPAAPSATPTATATPTTTATATAAAQPAAPAGQNARLAPGGVVAGGSGFPLHIQLTLDNTLGNGILAPGFQVQPSFGTSVNVRPSAMLPKLDGLPRTILTGSIDFSVSNWISASSNLGVYDRQVRVSDGVLAVIFPAIFKEDFTGIVASLVVSGRAPLSIASRQQNLLTNLGGAVQFMWGSPETPVGSFFVQYTPSARFALYSEVGPTIRCETPVEYGLGRPVGDPINGVDELPVAYGREQERLPNGDCIIGGRQNVASINNAVATGWSTNDGAHNVTLSASWAHLFLRPLKNEPGLSSDFASSQNFNESTSGSLSYTYTVPVDFNMFLTTGVFSQQPLYTADGQNLRFPLYDFVTPANNFSGVFFDVTVGI